MRKIEVKKVPENIKMVPSGGEVKVSKKAETRDEVRENRPLVEAMKVRLEHEMQDRALHEPALKPEPMERLLKLTIEVRGGGIASPFEATLTEVGAQTILDCLKA